jgi:hypothetical protein
VKKKSRKLSEMISEMAAYLIDDGETPEEKQNRLNAACSAWNMACVSPKVRQQQLEGYMSGYKRFNSAASSDDLANIRKDMESLIERKLQMFPDDKRQIVNARIVTVGQGYRIEIASAKL